MGLKGGSLQQQPKAGRLDWFKWLIIVILVLAGVVANFYYASVTWSIRAAIGIVVTVVLLLIAFRTQKGAKAWGFIKSARSELRKVVWPTRQETIQTTLVVVAMVVVTALLLWGLDSLFMWLIGWFTGQRG